LFIVESQQIFLHGQLGSTIQGISSLGMLKGRFESWCIIDAKVIYFLHCVEFTACK